MPDCSVKHKDYAGKCPYCHKKLPSTRNFSYSDIPIKFDASVPEDEVQVRHPDGRVDKFKITE